jgi:hypothetical protein
MLKPHCWNIGGVYIPGPDEPKRENGDTKKCRGNMQKLGILILDHPKKMDCTYTGILGSFSPDESSKFWQIPSGNLTVGY